MAANFESPWYPFDRVQDGYCTYKGTEIIPKKLVNYLLDLPDRAGYVPVDDNSRPRVRLMKYLWHDGAHPLSKALPTREEKISLLFDGEEPVVDTTEQKKRHPKGYRLFPQQYWGQAQSLAQSTIKVYIGRVIPLTSFTASVGVYFEILCNYGHENTTKTDAYSRSYDMEQCLLESLNGVNIGGAGVMSFDRLAHPDNGSRPIYDEGTNVGRRLHMSLAWAESDGESVVTTF
nr:MAG TPA: hypothetical protein [Caudoviricetes sp.]